MGMGSEAVKGSAPELLLARIVNGVEQKVYRYDGLLEVHPHREALIAGGFTPLVLTLCDSLGCMQVSYTKTVGGGEEW